MRVLRVVLAILLVVSSTRLLSAAEPLKSDVQRGVIAILGMPAGGPASLIQLAARHDESTNRLLYVQVERQQELKLLQDAFTEAGVLGLNAFVDRGSYERIQLADNIVDEVIVTAAATVDQQEVMRVLRPQGKAQLAGKTITKPIPSGYDQWTHPYHGADNNPQSKDQFVKGRFNTHFLSLPKFSPMPEQSVIAGGRIYKAMGHIAHKANQNRWLNTLVCINAYNGTMLWERPLPKGFMIHRNTMIATDDGLLMGDHQSCKVINGKTGEIDAEITVPGAITDGPVWKWMAVRDGVLYGLVGNLEIKVDTQKSERRGLGHWPWGMWKGHDYDDPRTAFGFGRTIAAIDIKTRKLLWHHRDEQFLDARAVCMNDDHIYCFTAEHFLACFDRESGKLLWKNSDKDLLEAVGPNQKAQHYTTGYSTTCYIKCDNDRIYFAGPQRERMVVASAKDGSLQWTRDTGNLQLVLRPEGVYAAGKQGTTGVRLDHKTGSVLSEFPARRACTRATGCVDSIFYRASGGTVRVLTETNQAQHIAPMRPPCQDGVLISNGHLYWGPWMCGCQLSLYGNICLEPAEPVASDPDTIYQDARWAADDLAVAKFEAADNDWPVYRGNNARSDVSPATVPDGISKDWEAMVCDGALPTAPVVAGDLVFVGDRTGALHAYNSQGKEVWRQYTAGPIYYPPAIANGRALVGSADGRVYAFEAATGRPLWSFRVAPKDSRIVVYGQLISRWPVAGGIVEHNGMIYAAAGIAHYDGTYIVALDAENGKLKSANVESGMLAPQVAGGISMQGNLSITESELQFLGGGVYEVARYDLATLKCLNEPRDQVTSQFRTAFYPFYPDYGKYVSLDYTCGDGATLCHDASYEGSLFTNLSLESPLPPGVTKPRKEAARWLRRRGRDAEAPKAIWRDQANRRFTSFIVTEKRLVAAAHPDGNPNAPVLVATDVRTGKDIWKTPLESNAVKGGAAIDAAGNIYITLEDGRLQRYVAK